MEDWQKVLLKCDDTIESAIEVLDKEPPRIVLIISQIGRLVGTVTDGDIRRAMIKKLPLNTNLERIMSKNPRVVNNREDSINILAIMKKESLLQVPVVDDNFNVVGLETLQHLLEGNKYDNPVFIMAGGFGKRLRPLTDNVPKPMLKIGDKPILEIILRQFVDYGFHDFYISTHYKANIVKEHFGDGSSFGVSIKYVHEDKPLGTAGALSLLPKNNLELPILMMNGDLLTKVNFEQLLNFHDDNGEEASICVREYDFQVPYGVIEANGHYVKNIVEKPMHKFFVNAGIYVINQSVLDLLDGGYLDMTQLLESIIYQGGRVSMFPLHEYWLDIGQIEHFNQAQVDSRGLFCD